MTTPIPLQPDNATAWELAVSLTSAERHPAPYGLLKTLWDPWTCPIQFLPFLARALSVDIWRDDWPETKKRAVVARAKQHHRHKGSEWLHGEYLKLLDIGMRKYTAAPAHFVPRRDWTKAERDAWLAQFQQIRIYPRVPVTRDVRGFAVASAARSRAFCGRIFATGFNRELNGFLREARLYDPLTDTETTLTRKERTRQIAHVGEVYDYEEIVLPSTRGGFVVGDHLPNIYASVDLGAIRTIRTAIARPGKVAVSRDQWSSVIPTGRLVSIQPELIRETFTVRRSVLSRMSTGLRSSIVPKEDPAWRHVYERFYLFDQTRNRGRSAGQPGSVVNRARLGIRPHTAEIKARVWSKARRRTFVIGTPPGRVVRAHESRTADALEAVNAARLLGDRVKINTRTRRKVQFGDRIPFSAGIRFGAYVED
tara:strand:+ start:24832 stop:26103 length:1272 start_codon:yes stop_codon:yes gene_type:complete